MPSDDTVYLSFSLPLQWWRRLQRVADTCYASPRDFVREVVEAEIVRRELLLEQQGAINPDWLRFVTDLIPSSRLQ